MMLQPTNNTDIKYNISFQRENYDNVIEEIIPLLHDHYREIGLPGMSDIQLDPEYDKYKQMNENGDLLIVTMRDGGTLVGYILLFASHHLHHKDLIVATTDLIYIKKEYRGKYFKLFTTWLEDLLLKFNIDMVIYAISANNDFSRPMERMGYYEFEKYMAKNLKGDR